MDLINTPCDGCGKTVTTGLIFLRGKKVYHEKCHPDNVTEPTPPTPKDPTIRKELEDQIDKLFEDYKLHHKDLDVCFHDRLAQGHIKRQILNLFKATQSSREAEILLEELNSLLPIIALTDNVTINHVKDRIKELQQTQSKAINNKEK